VATPRRKQSGERRKQSTIGWPQRGASLLPAEHHELMSQHEQLDVFGELAAPASDQQPQHSREGEIGERKEHEADAPIAPTEGGKSEGLGLGRPPIGCEAQCDLVFARARQPLKPASKPAQPTGAVHRAGILKSSGSYSLRQQRRRGGRRRSAMKAEELAR
jgi:hypothetical protein